MTAQMLLFPDLPGTCRTCFTRRYTARELNVSPGQDWRCYRCFTQARWPGFGLIPCHLP